MRIEHPLAMPRVSALLAFFGPSSAGLTLMGLTLNQRNFVFWSGFVIALCGVAATLVLYFRELRTFGRQALLVIIVAVVQASIPLLVLLVPQEKPAVSSDTSTDPRKELARMGVSYSGHAFDEAVREGQLDVLELFFKAGFSPNRLSANDYFSLTMAITFNKSDFASELVLFKKYGLDFKKFNPNQRLTQEEEAFYHAALQPDYQKKMRELKEQGADPSSFISKIHSFSIPNANAVKEIQHVAN